MLVDQLQNYAISFIGQSLYLSTCSTIVTSNCLFHSFIQLLSAQLAFQCRATGSSLQLDETWQAECNVASICRLDLVGLHLKISLDWIKSEKRVQRASVNHYYAALPFLTGAITQFTPFVCPSVRCLLLTR